MMFFACSVALAISRLTSSPRSETIPISQNNERACACKTYRNPLPSHKNAFPCPPHAHMYPSDGNFPKFWPEIGTGCPLSHSAFHENHLSTRHPLEVPLAEQGGAALEGLSPPLSFTQSQNHAKTIINFHESSKPELLCLILQAG